MSQLRVFFDFGFAADKTDRKSRSGWIGFRNGGVFLWSSLEQLSVSLAKAEYVSLLECCPDAQDMLRFLYELNIIMDDASKLYVDNTAAINWNENSISMRKANRIDL